MVTVPSSEVRPPTVCVPAMGVIVNVPVASVAAEKIAVSPLAHVVAALAPLESVVQFAVVAVSHVPAGVAPPAPAVAPFMSQYLGAANACTLRDNTNANASSDFIVANARSMFAEMTLRAYNGCGFIDFEPETVESDRNEGPRRD